MARIIIEPEEGETFPRCVMEGIRECAVVASITAKGMPVNHVLFGSPDSGMLYGALLTLAERLRPSVAPVAFPRPTIALPVGRMNGQSV